MNRLGIWLGVWALLFMLFFGISFRVIGVLLRWTALSPAVVVLGVAIFALAISGGLTVQAYDAFNPRQRRR
jgi:hypothetical protein